MPYILSPPVPDGRSGVWGEGDAYHRSNIYEIEPDSLPPVHYDQHLLRPHSLTHAEAPGHVAADGERLDTYFDRPGFFYGWCLVIRLPDRYVEDEMAHRIYPVGADDLAPHLEGHDDISKVLITADGTPRDEDGFHATHHVLVLEESAARLLVERPNFDLFGTSYRSTDYQPASTDRPIHTAIFHRAVILEYLDLIDVPSGRYFLSAFPVRLSGATESPVTPVLYTKDEISTG